MELAKTDEGLRYTQEQINLIKNTVAKGSTDDELKMFTGIAQKYGLDPFIKEIWFIKRAKKVQKNGSWDYPRLSNGEIDYKDAETIIMTSRDGYLKVAQRDIDFNGIISFAVREGDIFEVDAQNYCVTHKFGAKRGTIIGAWAKVDHKNRKPVIVYADYKEYSAGNSPIWKQYPTAMIQKVAEVLALKRQFGISGLVTKEEMTSQYDESIEESEPRIIEPEIIPTPPPEPPKRNYRKEIGNMLIEMVEGDVQKASEMLKEYTSFEGDKGKVEGKSKLDEVTEKMLKVTYGKIKKDYQVFKAEPIIIDEQEKLDEIIDKVEKLSEEVLV
jgi:phage recombination protein Bet